MSVRILKTIGFWEWLISLLIIGFMTISLVEQLSRVMVILGIGTSFFFAIFYLLYYRKKIPPEVILFFIWVIWSLSGWFVAVDRTLFIVNLITVCQIVVLTFMIAGEVNIYERITPIMFAIIIGGIILTLSGYISGQFTMASESSARLRATGLAENPNQFSYQLIFVLFAVFYFWRPNISLINKLLLSCIILFSLFGIIYSGSRKSFLAAIFFITVWFILCQGQFIKKRPFQSILIFIIICISIYLIATYTLNNTYLGRRLSAAAIEHGSESRIRLYKDGFKMIMENPVMGVGLNNFRVFSTYGLYSHSDYIEVAANTGIIGFLIYFSIYLFLWFRLWALKKMTNDEHIHFTIGLFRAAILTILLLAFGRPNITSKITWTFIASAIGYSYSKMARMNQQNV